MTLDNQPPPEDGLQQERLSDDDRFRASREKPRGIETKRGIINIIMS